MKTYKNSRKALSREDTVIDVYRKLTGNDTLDGQMWTLCALDDEFNHLTDVGFLTADQYHGIDFDPSNIEANVKAHPDANWYCGDFYTILSSQGASFNPAIVNFDSTWMEGAIDYTERLIAFLENRSDVMLISNIVLATRQFVGPRGLHPDEMDRRLASSMVWRRAQSLGWQKLPVKYTYQGNANTTMQTHVFYS